MPSKLKNAVRVIQEATGLSHQASLLLLRRYNKKHPEAKTSDVYAAAQKVIDEFDAEKSKQGRQRTE